MWFSGIVAKRRGYDNPAAALASECRTIFKSRKLAFEVLLERTSSEVVFTVCTSVALQAQGGDEHMLHPTSPFFAAQHSFFISTSETLKDGTMSEVFSPLKPVGSLKSSSPSKTFYLSCSGF